MEYRFNADDWMKLSNAQRVLRCRLMAEEARKLAHAAAGAVREDYLQIAKNWEQLARDIERDSN